MQLSRVHLGSVVTLSTGGCSCYYIFDLIHGTVKRSLLSEKVTDNHYKASTMTFYLLSLLLGITQCRGNKESPSAKTTGVQLITRPKLIPFSHYLNLLNPPITILIRTNQGVFFTDLPGRAKASDLYDAAELRGFSDGTFWYSGKELVYDDHRRLSKVGIGSGSVIEFDDFEDDIEDELEEAFPIKDPKTAMVIIQNLLERTPVVGRGYTYTDFIVLKLRRDVGFDIILDEVSVRVERTENGMTGTFHISGVDLCIDNLEIRDHGIGDVSFLLDILPKGPEKVNRKTTTIVIAPDYFEAIKLIDFGHEDEPQAKVIKL